MRSPYRCCAIALSLALALLLPGCGTSSDTAPEAEDPGYYLDGQRVDLDPLISSPYYQLDRFIQAQPAAANAVVYEQLGPELQQLSLEDRAITATIDAMAQRRPILMLPHRFAAVPPSQVADEIGGFYDTEEHLETYVNPLLYLERRQGAFTATLLTQRFVEAEDARAIEQSAAGRTTGGSLLLDGYTVRVVDAGPDSYGLWRARSFAIDCAPDAIQGNCLYAGNRQDATTYQGNLLVIISAPLSVYNRRSASQLVMVVNDGSQGGSALPVATASSPHWSRPSQLGIELQVLQLRSGGTSAYGGDQLAQLPGFRVTPS